MMKPWTLTHDVGVGDFFDADSFWSPEKKAALTTIYHAWPHSQGSDALIEIVKACPWLAHVEHKALSYPTERPPGSIVTLRDQPIFHRLTYHGSSFLEGPLDCQLPTGLPEAFAYIQPSTPKNGENCTRFIRDEEWTGVIARLEQWGLVGLVVNIPGGKATVPDHPLLIDWTGKTSMPQSIEVLKRAHGYIGVDSCFAILAAQLFAGDRLAIRTNNPFVVDYPSLHYPPHKSFEFLYPRLDQPGHSPDRPDPKPGKIVELRCNALIIARTYGGGSRVEVEPDRAERMLASGQAIPVEDLES